MIRINLLKGRTSAGDRLPSTLDAEGGPVRFLTRRELGLAAALVLTGGAIITAQVMGVFEEPAASEEQYEAVYQPPPPSEQQSLPPASQSPPPSEQQSPPPASPSDEPDPALQVAEDPPASAVPTAAAVVAPAAGAADPAFGAEPRHSVAALRVVPWGEAVELMVVVEGTPEYDSFWLSNPERLVLDVQDAQLQAPRSELNQAAPHPLIARVRAAQNSFEPPLVRVVIETTRDGVVDISSTSEGVSIRLSPAP